MEKFVLQKFQNIFITIRNKVKTSAKVFKKPCPKFAFQKRKNEEFEMSVSQFCSSKLFLVDYDAFLSK